MPRDSDSVQEKEREIITKRFGLVLPELFIEITSGLAHCGGAHLAPEKFLSDAPESSGAHPLKEKPADGGVYIGMAPLILVEELKVHRAFRHTGHPQTFQKTVTGDPVSQVMAAVVSLPPEAAFVFSGVHFGGDLILQKTFKESPESLFERGGMNFRTSLWTSTSVSFTLFSGVAAGDFIGVCLLS